MRSPTFSVFLLVASCAAVAAFARQRPDIFGYHFFSLSGKSGSEINQGLLWPPKVGDDYPDLELRDVDDHLVRLSQYRGRILIIESVGTPCPACQAFSGGHEVGAFDSVQPQPGLGSFKDYFRDWTGYSLSDSRVRLIQIIFFGPNGRSAPTLDDAQRWASHFSPDLPADSVVLFADHSLLSTETRSMIPGFQLVDQDFVLRCDAGNPPRQDVYRELLPMARKLLDSDRL